MYYTRCLVTLALVGFTLGDKSVDSTSQDSYENGVGTSFSVPLNPPNSAVVNKNSRKYSVSGDDLAQAADLTSDASYKSPVYIGASVASYSPPKTGLDHQEVPGLSVAQDRDGSGGHHHHAHHDQHGAAAQPQAAASSSYQVISDS